MNTQVCPPHNPHCADSTAAVPEPASYVLLALGLFLLVFLSKFVRK